MYKTIIVDDEPKNMRILKKLLQDYCPQISIIGEAGDVNAAHKIITELNPEIVLLDIEMPYGNAFDLLDKLMPVKFEVIFITAYNNYSIKAFRYSAVDYLLKPVDIRELQDATQKAINRITANRINEHVSLLLSNLKDNANSNPKIAVPTPEGYVFVHIEDIIRCESNGAYTYIYTVKKERVVASKNIKEYEEILPKTNFFRIHNSHLVNLNRILRYNKGRGGTVTMEDGTELEVASRRRTEFLDNFK
ncbi:MAG: LytTR family DNA-binding domain-containing protein [Ferruginibacter sp.]